jgi:hypothetical protein
LKTLSRLIETEIFSLTIQIEDEFDPDYSHTTNKMQ